MTQGGKGLLPIICLITDGTLVPMGELVPRVAAAVGGGVTMVQLREKDLPTRELLDLATRLRVVVRPPAVLLVNGRADVAYAAGADGVHLPEDGLPVAGARGVLMPDSNRGESLRAALEGGPAVAPVPPFRAAASSAASPVGAPLVGRSVHSVDGAVQAATEGADYVELGTVFPSRSHPGGRTIGLEGVRAAAAINVPLLAVGGITADNAANVIAAGANGVAVISAILAASNPEQAARQLADVVHAAWHNRRGAAGDFVASGPAVARGEAPKPTGQRLE